MYNPVNNNTVGIRKMILEEFKILGVVNRVEYINKFLDGKKNLRINK